MNLALQKNFNSHSEIIVNNNNGKLVNNINNIKGKNYFSLKRCFLPLSSVFIALVNINNSNVDVAPVPVNDELRKLEDGHISGRDTLQLGIPKTKMCFFLYKGSRKKIFV